MGIVTQDLELISTIPPEVLFKALVLDFDTLSPKVHPQYIKNVEIHEGDGGEGTIKLITFGEACAPFESTKKRVDLLDKENKVYKYSIIMGEPFKGVLESISIGVQVVASPDVGSIFKLSSTQYFKGDVEIKEEDIKGGKEIAASMFREMEAYIKANPNY